MQKNFPGEVPRTPPLREGAQAPLPHPPRRAYGAWRAVGPNYHLAHELWAPPSTFSSYAPAYSCSCDPADEGMWSRFAAYCSHAFLPWTQSSDYGQPNKG